MTPLPNVSDALQKYEIAHEVLACDPALADTAAFCERYGFTLEESANTILVTSRKTDPIVYAVCVVQGCKRLDVNKKVCELLGVKRASFASTEVTASLTGMEIGGVVALGISELPIYIDSAVMDQPRVVMGGGNRSSKIVLNPKELFKLPGVQVVDGLAYDIPT